MQGFLSDLFGGGGSKADAADQHASAEDEAALNAEVGVHTHGQATYTDADGTTHTVESGQDVTVDADLDGILGTEADADEGSTTGG